MAWEMGDENERLTRNVYLLHSPSNLSRPPISLVVPFGAREKSRQSGWPNIFKLVCHFLILLMDPSI